MGVLAWGSTRTRPASLSLDALRLKIARLAVKENLGVILTNALLSVTEQVFFLLLMINAMLLVLGMIMDMAALILICTPIFLPVVTGLGMDPLQFGMLLMMNLGLGLCTPPVGTVLFIGAGVAKLPIAQVARALVPFFVVMVVACCSSRTSRP